MATITKKPNGDLKVDLTPAEQDTYDDLPAGQLEAFVTLWLKEQQRALFVQQFDALGDHDKGMIVRKLRKLPEPPNPGQ